MLILGLDPGSHQTGFGLIKKDGELLQAVDFGLLKYSDNSTVVYKKLYDDLTKIIRKHNPDFIAIEKLFYFKNQKTIIQVAQSRGIMLLAALQNNVKTIELTPLQIKQSVTGSGRADKASVAKMVTTILKLSSPPKPDDVSDALATALTGVQVAKNVIPRNS